MLTCDLKESVLIEPIRQGATSLCIVSGYATPSMASWHLKTIREAKLSPIEITLLVGMCPEEGLNMNYHSGFCDIVNYNSNLLGYSKFKCQYVYEGLAVHSKLYIWLKDNTPFLAFVGSANYTQTAFSNKRKELLEKTDPVESYHYFNDVEKHTIYCTNHEIDDVVLLHNQNRIHGLIEESVAEYSSDSISNRVTLSLLSNSGDVGIHSGLNWGQRQKRSPNEAYIPLPSHIAKTGFFPLEKQHFTVVTDDNKSLILRVEQQNNKAITTPENNSRIGEYFRNRLNLANGSAVTRQDLERYGRATVDFYKFDDEHYYMDFSKRN